MSTKNVVDQMSLDYLNAFLYLITGLLEMPGIEEVSSTDALMFLKKIIEKRIIEETNA